MAKRALLALTLAGLALSPGLAWGAPVIGVWGGDQVELDLTADGGVLKSGCAEGRLAGPLTPDLGGRFRVAGTFETYMPGPQRDEEARADAAATYSGRIDGQTLSLTVTTAKGRQTHVLTQGRRPRLVRCL